MPIFHCPTLSTAFPFLSLKEQYLLLPHPSTVLLHRVRTLKLAAVCFLHFLFLCYFFAHVPWSKLWTSLHSMDCVGFVLLVRELGFVIHLCVCVCSLLSNCGRRKNAFCTFTWAIWSLPVGLSWARLVPHWCGVHSWCRPNPSRYSLYSGLMLSARTAYSYIVVCLFDLLNCNVFNE